MTHLPADKVAARKPVAALVPCPVPATASTDARPSFGSASRIERTTCYGKAATRAPKASTEAIRRVRQRTKPRGVADGRDRCDTVDTGRRPRRLRAASRSSDPRSVVRNMERLVPSEPALAASPLSYARSRARAPVSPLRPPACESGYLSIAAFQGLSRALHRSRAVSFVSRLGRRGREPGGWVLIRLSIAGTLEIRLACGSTIPGEGGPRPSLRKRTPGTKVWTIHDRAGRRAIRIDRVTPPRTPLRPTSATRFPPFPATSRGRRRGGRP